MNSTMNKILIFCIISIIVITVILICVHIKEKKEYEKRLKIRQNTKLKIAEYLITKKFLDNIDKPIKQLFGNCEIEHQIETSLQIVNNFERYKTFDYLIKYFDFNIDNETLNNLYAILQEIDNIEMYIKYNIQDYLQEYARSCARECYPHFTMNYISPGGNSYSSSTFWLDSDGIIYLIENVNKIIKKREPLQYQRNKLTPAIRESVLHRDNFTCCICGNSLYKEPNLLLEVDHIIPISKGGKTEPNNLQTLCWKCNRAKSNRIEVQ